MKMLHTQIICILICLTPTFIDGQTLQLQKQLLPSPLLQGTTSQNSRQMTDSPILRLSNTGPMGEDGIRLELTSLPLLDPGPSMFMDMPDPMVPGSGAIRLQPNGSGSYCKIEDIGSGTIDCIMFSLGPAIVAPYRPRIGMIKPKVAGIQSAIIVQPGENTSELSIYDSGTSGIGATLGYATFPNYYQVNYDMNGMCGTSYADLHCTNTFIPDTGKYVSKIISSDPAYFNNFFQTSYKLSPLETTQTANDLYEKVTWMVDVPKHSKTVSSTNPMFSNRSFTSFVNLSDYSYGVGFGFDPDDLCLVNFYEDNPPKLRTKIQSSNPLYIDSFFDISYELDIGSVVTKYRNWQHGEQYNESDWNFITSLSSNDPGIPGFFDITYDISVASALKHWTRSGGTGNPPLEMRFEYDALNRKIKEVNTDFQDGSFFDITYDFPLQRLRTECNNLVSTGIFSDGTRHEITFTSNEPSIPSFFDITYEIGLPGVQKHTIKAGSTGGMMPLENRIEFDELNRKIRFVYNDLENGSTSLFEQRFGPGEPTYRVGCRLEMAAGKSIISQSGPLTVDASLDVTGTMSSSSGPLAIGDDLFVNGGSHTINGNLTISGPTNQINGNLHVNGTLTANNKMFRIDHPLDPEHKYLFHSCVESPDMMNIYNGNAMTDDNGFATIQLPDYFEALNTDFRYQLTCIGQFAMAIIAKKISDNQFTIQTDKPHVEVSWQVTGVRQDPGAKQTHYTVEAEKEASMKVRD